MDCTYMDVFKNTCDNIGIEQEVSLQWFKKIFKINFHKRSFMIERGP